MLGLQFGEDEGKYNYAGLPEHADTGDGSNWQSKHTAGSDIHPDGVKGHSEKVVEQHHWLANYASEKANWSINTLAAELEVAEAPSLERLELWVY